MTEHWSARQYLKEVWGYDFIEDVDRLTMENIQENADMGYHLDKVLVRARQMSDAKSTTEYRAVFTDDDRTFAKNDLTFNTVEAAILYARGLFSRWMGASAWAVIPVSLEPDDRGFWTKALIEAEAIEKSF